MVRTVLQAVGLVIFLTAATVPQMPDSSTARMAAAWSQLTPEQQELIDIVATDIWENERALDHRRFKELSNNVKHGLRAEAMDRLGFKPPQVAGVEV